ncbi:MAG TPA: putative inorganic carbon transporter subunit DabA, partial [Lacunisphaera sp.]
VPAERLDAAVRARAVDIAEVRPEWGLANNAALVAAPRSRTAGLNLAGRVFLHDYDAAADPDDRVLTLILCAPVVVASWINLQYYASRVDPVRYGSGNKVLHHVVGGLGVLEGNGGDLKVGLPLQSIHDGKDFVHEPRRLAVYLEAEPGRISAVLAKQPAVRQLFDHGWLHLFALQSGDCFRYRQGQWLRMAAGQQ